MNTKDPAKDRPELRRDPITGRWVMIAPDRGRRPSVAPPAAPGSPGSRNGGDPCPFCPGNEGATPPEVAGMRDPDSAPDTPGWRTRVFPNKFAALHPAGEPETSVSGIYERMDGVGAHEVIVETPEHDAELSELPVGRIAEVLEVCRERARDHAADPRVRYVIPFKNHGVWSGASQEHGHTQLLAIPVIPNAAREELEECERRHRTTGRCSFCALIEQDRKDGTRVILDQDGFVAIAPYASRFAFETWILPIRHQSSFETASPEALRGLAQALRDTLGGMRRELGRTGYNFLIHSAPARETALPWYHWHMELVPKLSLASGCEWGTGAYINAVPPEEAAARLRASSPVEPPAA